MVLVRAVSHVVVRRSPLLLGGGGGGGAAARFSVPDMLQMALMTYSLLGDGAFAFTEEKEMQDAVVRTLLAGNAVQSRPTGWLGPNLEQALLAARRQPDSECGNVDEFDRKQVELEVIDRTQETFRRLQAVGAARSTLLDYRSLLLQQGSYQSLLSQALSHVLNSKKRGDLRDIEHITSSLQLGKMLRLAVSAVEALHKLTRTLLTHSLTLSLALLFPLPLSPPPLPACWQPCEQQVWLVWPR